LLSGVELAVGSRFLLRPEETLEGVDDVLGIVDATRLHGLLLNLSEYKVYVGLKVSLEIIMLR